MKDLINDFKTLYEFYKNNKESIQTIISTIKELEPQIKEIVEVLKKVKKD